MREDGTDSSDLKSHSILSKEVCPEKNKFKTVSLLARTIPQNVEDIGNNNESQLYKNSNYFTWFY